ncbi:DUF3734 domain-containing protein [Parasphingopyxis marina]|uniref:DUF3734 domain-containing protein n=1 Tax=Parasphingopyxis marina TaxID=2761622 RepID=A0A842HX90_9SPHN|nr:DUF3734 domain-containing protein [Parasphingopyxis marina]MBC2776560.1 DUF3734 domain-containing protein [Parasphingopyxis marina]
MADADPPFRAQAPLPLPPQTALVLQGGGALGSFQAGVFEALADSRIEPNWLAGISIGAINAAIIAGNPVGSRARMLRNFWEKLTGALPSFPVWPDDLIREAVHEWSAGFVALNGVPGFFAPRPVPPAFAPPGSPEALSFYDSSPLESTLDDHVDWDLLNNGHIRLSVGAVNVESGNFRYFDTAKERIDARHIMASGALPPGLPPVEIDGCLWWDGGLVSNTPLQYVLEEQEEDMLVFQVDLFSAADARPSTIADVWAREKEIRYSSRTRQVTTSFLERRAQDEAIRTVLAKLPAAMREDPDVAALAALAQEKAVNIVHLIYRSNAWEGGSRDYEFSRRTMDEHWQAGGKAVAETIRHGEVLARNIVDGKTAAFDLTPR